MSSGPFLLSLKGHLEPQLTKKSLTETDDTNRLSVRSFYSTHRRKTRAFSGLHHFTPNPLKFEGAPYLFNRKL